MKELTQLFLVVTLFGGMFGVPFTKNREEYNMHILEKGVEFDQKVELDESEQVVTVHVPSHENVDETYFITDINAHLTMKVAPQQKICFLIKNDPEELPTLDVWRKTKEFTKDKVITDAGAKIRRRSYVITEPVTPSEWASIPRQMKRVCSGLPVVWTEAITDELEQTQPEAGQEWITYINYTKPADRRRFKRQLPDDTFVDECSAADSAQRCVIYDNSCYRVLTCTTEKDVNGRDGSDCNQMGHIYEDVRCCKPCCKADVPADNPSPSCAKPFTKETLCPNKVFL